MAYHLVAYHFNIKILYFWKHYISQYIVYMILSTYRRSPLKVKPQPGAVTFSSINVRPQAHRGNIFCTISLNNNTTQYTQYSLIHLCSGHTVKKLYTVVHACHIFILCYTSSLLQTHKAKLVYIKWTHEYWMKPSYSPRELPCA